MYRHSPGRSQRPKGIKIKHVLQICLLVAVCFWLIFQVKRSHDKKKEFDASDTKVSASTQSSDEIIKFGRKDLHPKLEETAKEVEKHDEEEDEHEEQEEHETGVEEEENKHEEDEEQEEDKMDEEKDDARGGGDDEIDESEQEKSDMEFDREEEDRIDEDKEKEESDEKENEENDDQSQTENENSSEDHDHDQDGVTRNTHEAREELYKADDASSAVTHDAQTINTENQNGTSENSRENLDISAHENQVDNGEEINAGQNANSEVKEKDGETSESGPPSNGTVIQTVPSELPNSSLNSTSTIDSNDLLGQSNNVTEISSNSTKASNVMEEIRVSGEHTSNSTIAASDDNQSGSNSTQATNETGYSLNSTNISEIVEPHTISTSNGSASNENGSDSSKTEVDPNAGQGENSDTDDVTERTEETSESSETENPDDIQHDTVDSAEFSHLDEKQVRMDLDTLPEIVTEGGNSEDAAAE